MAELHNPVVLLGSPRSGTTLLGHVFSAHPAVHYANEPRLLWRYGNDRHSDSLDRTLARPDVVRHIRGTFERQVHDAGRTALVEKTPANCLRVGFVDAVLPGARYIHIVRDGREAVAAIYEKWRTKANGVTSGAQRGRLLRRLREAQPRQIIHYAPELLGRLHRGGAPSPWGPRLPGMGEMTRDLPLIEVCALQWRWCVEAVLRERAALGDRLMAVDLETLDPSVVERLHRHSRLPDAGLDLMLREFGTRFDVAKTGGRFALLDDQERRRVEAVIEPTMRMLGRV